MIVPIEVERAEAAASRMWQLVFEARGFGALLSRSLRNWSQAGQTARQLWVTDTEPLAHRFQLAHTRRLAEQQSVYDMIARLPAALRELRRELALARHAATCLGRARHGQTRRELAAVIRAARRLRRIECAGEARTQPRADTLEDWLALDRARCYADVGVEARGWSVDHGASCSLDTAPR